MNASNRSLIMTTCFLMLASFASAHAPDTLGFSLLGNAVPATPLQAEVEVFDEYTGFPIRDAKITHAMLDGAQVVQVSRAGYVSGSIVGVKSPRVRFHLKPLAALGTSAVANGKLQQYLPYLAGHVEGGLVLRSLGIADLLALNVDSLISPLKDEIQVMGRREIPSNLVFPDQRVGLVIRLNKPTYRLPVSTSRRLHLVAAQATMGVKDLIDQLGNTRPVDLVNLLKMRKVGWTEKLAPRRDFAREIPLQHELNAGFQVNFENPPFPADVFALSVLDLQSDAQTLIPTDVKAAKVGAYEGSASKSLGLKTLRGLPAGASQRAIVAAVSPKGDRISARIAPVVLGQVPAFTFLEAPQLSPDARSVGMRALQTGVSILNWVREEAGSIVEAHQVAVLPGAGQAEVPALEWSERGVISSYSVSQLEFGPEFSETEIDGVDILRRLKRFTYSRSDGGGLKRVPLAD